MKQTIYSLILLMLLIGMQNVFAYSFFTTGHDTLWNDTGTNGVNTPSLYNWSANSIGYSTLHPYSSDTKSIVTNGSGVTTYDLTNYMSSTTDFNITLYWWWNATLTNTLFRVDSSASDALYFGRHTAASASNWGYYDGTTWTDSGTPIATGTWVTVTLSINLSTNRWRAYINDSLVVDWRIPANTMVRKISLDPGAGAQNNFFARLHIWNGTTGDIFISALNCTSCNPPTGDTVAPYTTNDTTPTFTFTTSDVASCRIADMNWNYTIMGSSRDCAGGQGTTSHTCTLTAQDELNAPTSYVHIGCSDGDTRYANSGALEMELTSFVNNASAAIDIGIQNSIVWPQATVYNDQQVYLRDLSNNQVLATIDRVVSYGNKRWLLNYEDNTTLGLFNITPVVYVLDMKNLTFSQIRTLVAALINSTN